MPRQCPDPLTRVATGEETRAASLRYLLARIASVEQRVRAALGRKASFAVNPSDPFRGLYISDQDIETLLASPPTSASHVVSQGGSKNGTACPGEAPLEHWNAMPGEPELMTLTRVFALTEQEVEFLLVALAPDLDRRFERFYGYLNDDVTQRRATIGLALELYGLSPADCTAVASVSEGGTLLEEGLLVLQEPDRPFLGRSLRVPDYVRAYLLGDHRTHPDLRPWVVMPAPLPAGSGLDPRALRLRDAELYYVRELRGASARSSVASALCCLGARSVFFDFTSAGPNADIAGLLRLARMQAALEEARLVVGPVERLLENGLLTLRGLEWRGAVLIGKSPWNPAWSLEVPVLLEAEPLPMAAQETVWREYLDAGSDAHLDAIAATAPFRLDPEQMQHAACAARLLAAADGKPMSTDHLVAGARAQGTAGLERLARRLDPSVCWDDLVLPEETVQQLRELSSRVRNRQVVLDLWALRRHSRGEGLTALFSGPSGTGKTMSAEVLARDLGLYLYVVNLAAVVDKYIGETEKNLDQIFREAETASCLLLFDEADALFGKRSDVKDAHDRYANTETAYLLQRMEEFDGIAILSTNLRSNLDDAFTRRLDSVVDFAIPQAELRNRLWENCLGSALPRSNDVDVPFLARAFELSGGHIRNVVVTAAHLAAAAGRPLTMGDLIRGTEREYRKLGRLCLEDDFGPYIRFLS
jgi:hypothetical protein